MNNLESLPVLIREQAIGFDARCSQRWDVRERIKSFERLFEMNDMIRFTVGSHSFLMNSGRLLNGSLKGTDPRVTRSLQRAMNPISWRTCVFACMDAAKMILFCMCSGVELKVLEILQK